MGASADPSTIALRQVQPYSGPCGLRAEGIQQVQPCLPFGERFDFQSAIPGKLPHRIRGPGNSGLEILMIII
jgi:hypothetical protein